LAEDIKELDFVNACSSSLVINVNALVDWGRVREVERIHTEGAKLQRTIRTVVARVAQATVCGILVPQFVAVNGTLAVSTFGVRESP
jgi:hypothetical protein